MIEPSLAVQTAIRAHLIPNQALTQYVLPASVRAGMIRPEHFPSVIIADGQTEFLGRAAGSQYAARVFFELHIWARETDLHELPASKAATPEDADDDAPDDEQSMTQSRFETGSDLAKIIGGVLSDALRDAPSADEISFDEWQLTRLVWPRDPDPAIGHGVPSIEAAIRWNI